MTRNEAAQALGKVFAYLACGREDLAREWATKLIDWLSTIESYKGVS
jgi:hypothetical protein